MRGNSPAGTAESVQNSAALCRTGAGEASASLGGTGGREGGEVFTAHKLVIKKGVGTVKEIVRTEVYGIAQRIIVADDKLIGVDVRIEDVAAP